MIKTIHKSGRVINGQFVYDLSRSRRHAEQTRKRAAKKRDERAKIELLKRIEQEVSHGRT
jgi:hypothetical protein